ncbi:hypothetical protein [Clostridium butyricum]|uniref:hypothetical protein n=1 Tax=Clostridium butyricum TaxID=1492 RepID=UPI0012B9BF69|nr:hypothetical protein [Clostridium butyricum]
MSECTLDFSTRLVDNTSNDGTFMNMMYRMDIQYKKLHTFDSTAQNADMYNKSKALEKVSEDFEKQFDLSKSLNQTANQQFWKCIQVAHWNSTIFQNKTLLNAMDYSRVQKPDHPLKLESYTAGSWS